MTQESAISGKTNHEGLTTSALPNNQLSGFGYDAAGNMTSNGSVNYVYDGENRLIWTSGLNPTPTRYIYDGDGDRVEKCAAATVTTACPTSGTTGTLYWRGTSPEPQAETDLSGNVLENYIFFGGQRIARRDASTKAVHFYFSDQVGSHGVVENATGTACEQDIDYYPYGGQENDYCANVAQHYKFNGKERDTESGLDNFEARYDASSLGRFMTADWAAKPTAVPYAHYGNPQSLNLYSFVTNNPTTFGDPDGHSMVLAAPGGGLISDGQVDDCKTDQQKCAAQNAQKAQNTSIVTVSATSSAPGTLLGGLIGELIDPIGGGIPGSILGSMVGVGADVSYVPSTDSTYAGPTVSFTPAPFGGNGVSVSDAIVPAGQNANSIANGTTYSVQFQPTPLTGSTVTKSPGSGPAVAGPSVGTKVPLSFSASHNFDITPAVRSVTNFVNRAINTVESWF